MKRLLIFSLILFAAFNLNARISDPAKSNPAGTICFIRETGFFGSAAADRIFIDDQFVCKLHNNRYFLHGVTAGKHTCSVQMGGKKSKQGAEKPEIEVLPGNTGYVNIILKIGAFINNVYCEKMSEETGKEKLNGSK